MNRIALQHPLRFALVAAVLAIISTPLTAQEPDPREILRTVEEADEARWQGVRSVTYTTRNLGMEMITRADVSFVDGRRQMHSRVLTLDGSARIAAEDLEAQLPGQMPVDLWHVTPAEEVRLEGTVRHDGRELDRIVLVRPELPVEALAMMQDADRGFQFDTESVTLLVDREWRLIPEVSFEGRMTNPEIGRSGEARFSVIQEDHFEADGLVFPRRTIMRSHMPPELMVPEGADPAEFAAMLDRLREMMRGLSEEERAGMESMAALTPLLDSFQSDGAMEMVSELVDVQVERQ